MSHGNHSPLYRPINQSIILKVSDIHGPVAAEIAHTLDGCHIESLLFVSLVHQYSEAARGNHYDLQFSALDRGGRGKLQTPEMKLLHDVRVELMMAGRQYKRLDTWLRKKNIALCHRHSCGDAMVPVSREDAWYDEMEKDQLNRTWLDWSGSHTIEHCFGCLSRKAFFPEQTRRAYDQIFDCTVSVLQSCGYEAVLPKISDFKIA